MDQPGARPRRTFRRTLAATAALLLLAACSGAADEGGAEAAADETPARGGTLRIADVREAASLNPYIALDGVSEKVFAQVLEPLFRTDTEGEIVPWLVSGSEPSADFTRWTLELREGVEFSDGTPLTADDVVYSIDTIRENPAWTTMYAVIDTVEASSPTTVEITTSAPAPALEGLLSSPFAPVVPRDLGGASPEEFGQEPIGTGPFKVEEWEAGKELRLVRNESYWDPERPYLDEVVFVPVTGDSSRVQQLSAGELDVIAEPPKPQLDALDRSPETNVGEYALAIPSYLMLNQASELFDDPRIREAVDLAVDRESILTAAVNGYGELGGSFLPPALDFVDESLTSVPRDPGRAEEVLAEAVAEGADPAFGLLITAGDTYQKLAAQIIKQNLEDVGFEVGIEQIDGSALLTQVAGGDYDATMFKMTSDILDPSELVAFYLDTDALWSGGNTEDVGALLGQAEREADQENRRALYEQLQQVVFDDRSLLLLNYQPWIWAMREDVVGYDLPMTGVPWLADVGFRAE